VALCRSAQPDRPLLRIVVIDSDGSDEARRVSD